MSLQQANPDGIHEEPFAAKGAGSVEQDEKSILR